MINNDYFLITIGILTVSLWIIAGVTANGFLLIGSLAPPLVAIFLVTIDDNTTKRGSKN